MANVFTEWQPRYAKLGIPTFPVRDKRPLVRGYLELNLCASDRLAIKFPTAEAFGLACRPNRITVVDVDSPDERLLAAALNRFGPTPFIVRSGSGHYQAWYRNSGESRRVRPDASKPIDVLGHGYVVAPPSSGRNGAYSIIHGSLEDLKDLPPLLCGAAEKPATVAPFRVKNGKRNDTLWRECMKRASQCSGIADLINVAATFNHTRFDEPLSEGEVLRVAENAWAKELSGENWFGRGGRVIVTAEEIDGLLHDYPDAFILLTILRRHHWGTTEFLVANAMAATMPHGGWTRQRFAAARRRLMIIGAIDELRPASSFHGPAHYRFKGVKN